jgi:hypothetical protein
MYCTCLYVYIHLVTKLVFDPYLTYELVVCIAEALDKSSCPNSASLSASIVPQRPFAGDVVFRVEGAACMHTKRM